MDAAERALLDEAVRQTLGATDDADGALRELGWREMLREEPVDAVQIVFGALGATNAASTALDDVMLTALGVDPERERTVLLPPFGSAAPPLDGHGLASARIATAEELLVVDQRVPTSSASKTRMEGLDPDLGLHRISVDVGATGPSGDAWPSALAAGQIALAHQIAGACRTMLDLARAHALERVQFDRPIARFQAVRHRLADALVAIEALDAGLEAAAVAPGPTTAALAKALAGRGARTVASHCQQVLAGIGFTTDHPFHRSLKRTMTLDGLLGSADALTLDLGRGLLATREVPTLVEL
jgi:hypothetical protein